MRASWPRSAVNQTQTSQQLSATQVQSATDEEIPEESQLIEMVGGPARI
jgi:hypothetical protein